MLLTASTLPAQTPLRVMSFNIRYDNPSDGLHVWPNRREGVVKMLDFHHIDIAGLQEVLKGQMDDIRRLAPSFASVGVGRADGKTRGEYAPIFYRKDRFELLDGGTFWLSETPEVVSSRGWDASLERIATWAKFRRLEDGREMFFLNTHFDHRGQLARENSAQLVAQYIQKLPPSLPVFVVGDLNSTPHSKAVEALLSAGPRHRLVDAKNQAGQKVYGPEGTFTGFNIQAQHIPTLDYIFINEHVDVLQFGTLSELWNGILPSDHRPVIAEVVID